MTDTVTELASAILPLVDKQSFRNAMAGLAGAVNVVTTQGPEGPAGFTATAVCSVTDEPPTLLVCLNRNASVYPAFAVSDALVVNTLGDGHSDLSNLFGGGKSSMAERFAAARWSTLASGAPVLDGAAVAFDCRIANRVSVGTHDVLFCEVVAIARTADVGGLVYFERQYHGVRLTA